MGAWDLGGNIILWSEVQETCSFPGLEMEQNMQTRLHTELPRQMVYNWDLGNGEKEEIHHF